MTVATTEHRQPPIRTNPGEGYAQREAGDISRIQTGTHAIGGARAPTAGGSLVILDPEAPSTTLRAALPHPDMNNGDISLLVVFPTAEYEARRRARREAGVTAPYTIDHLEAEARRIAQRSGHEWLDPTGVAFEPIGTVGRLHDCVQKVVEERGCTTVYVTAPRRALWQRLLGVGDLLTTLGRILPSAVTVVPIGGAFESGVPVTDTGASVEGLLADDVKNVADGTVVPDTSIKK